MKKLPSTCTAPEIDLLKLEFRAHMVYSMEYLTGTVSGGQCGRAFDMVMVTCVEQSNSWNALVHSAQVQQNG